MEEDPLIALPAIADGEDKTSPLKNRIRNNYRHIKKWAKRTCTNCFRIYDKDIKEYPLYIDYYDGCFSIQYLTSSRESDDPPRNLKDLAEEALCSIFNISQNAIYWRTRVKRKKTEQYEKRDATGVFFPVVEYEAKFHVNLTDYLDTGLFLDHRETRRHVAAQAKNKRLLNLFAYTCAFSVQAALGGAAFTKSVDLSNTYLAWGRENFLLNSLSLKNNQFIREDCLKFLDEARESKETYDLIVIDPPTISRSKKMEKMFDIQQDYPVLIKKAEKLLTPEGVIIFSTNSRKFVFKESYFSNLSVREITEKTIPLDFRRNIHYCWKLSLKK